MDSFLQPSLVWIQLGLVCRTHSHHHKYFHCHGNIVQDVIATRKWNLISQFSIHTYVRAPSTEMHLHLKSQRFYMDLKWYSRGSHSMTRNERESWVLKDRLALKQPAVCVKNRRTCDLYFRLFWRDAVLYLHTADKNDPLKVQSDHWPSFHANSVQMFFSVIHPLIQCLSQVQLCSLPVCCGT